jgi:hypothetical protein
MAHFRLEYIVVWPETGTTSVCVMPSVSYFPVHYNSTNLDQPVWAPATSHRIFIFVAATICTHFKHVMSASLCIPLSLRSRARVWHIGSSTKFIDPIVAIVHVTISGESFGSSDLVQLL